MESEIEYLKRLKGQIGSSLEYRILGVLSPAYDDYINASARILKLEGREQQAKDEWNKVVVGTPAGYVAYGLTMTSPATTYARVWRGESLKERLKIAAYELAPELALQFAALYAAKYLAELEPASSPQPTAPGEPPSSNLKTGKYGDLNGTLAPGEQANHLNQNAAFKTVIPQSEGAAVALLGDAFTQPGTAHFKFHKSLEGFWGQYRKGGTRFGTVPTNGEYSRALEEALKSAGYSAEDTAKLSQFAKENRAMFGLKDSDPVPRIPGRLPQKKE